MGVSDWGRPADWLESPAPEGLSWPARVASSVRSGGGHRLRGNHHGSSHGPQGPEKGGLGMLCEVAGSGWSPGSGARDCAERQVIHSTGAATRIVFCRACWFGGSRISGEPDRLCFRVSTGKGTPALRLEAPRRRANHSRLELAGLPRTSGLFVGRWARQRLWESSTERLWQLVKQLGDRCLWALPASSPTAYRRSCRKVLTLRRKVCRLLGALEFWPGSGHLSVSPVSLLARHALPISGRGLCPHLLVLTKRNIAEVGDLRFFFHCVVFRGSVTLS